MPHDDNTAIKDIHARSRNSKKNYRGMYFLRTHKALYSWEPSSDIRMTEKIMEVEDRDILKYSDDHIIVMQKSDN